MGQAFQFILSQKKQIDAIILSGRISFLGPGFFPSHIPVLQRNAGDGAHPPLLTSFRKTARIFPEN